MAKGEKTQAVLAAVKAAPLARNVDIARELGCTPSFVSTVRQRNRCLRVKFLATTVRLSPENDAWLFAEAERHGVSVSDLVNGIVTDARVEAELGGVR